MTSKALLLAFFGIFTIVLAWEGKMDPPVHECVHDEIEAHASTLPNYHATRSQGYEQHAWEQEIYKRDLRDVNALKRNMRVLMETDLIVNYDDFQCHSTSDTYTTFEDGGQQTSSCSEDDILTEEKKDTLLTKVIPWVEKKIEAMLKVDQVSGYLRLLPTDLVCASGPPQYYSIQNVYRNPGVNATDFVVYVTSRRHGTRDSTLAWALTCYTDQFGRPTHGQINFNPSRIETSASSVESMRAVALHEMFHALGFSRGRMSAYRQANGNPYPAPGPFLDISTIQSDGSTHVVRKVITPNVQIQVISYFNCPASDWPTTPGAELEDLDRDFSHWEKRLFYNEVMTATASAIPSLSPLTVALFSDMGWYAVDYFVSDDELTWGKGEGCRFAFGNCATDWPEYYRCSETRTGCVPGDYFFRGECKLEPVSGLPAEYTYFGDNRGGTNKYADFCPIYQAYSNGDCRDSEKTNWFADNLGLSTQKGESNSNFPGQESKCYYSTLSPVGFSLISPLGNDSVGCYPTRCRDTVELKVNTLSNLGEGWRTCPKEGVTLKAYSGSITCPSFCQFCDPTAPECWPASASTIFANTLIVLLALAILVL